MFMFFSSAPQPSIIVVIIFAIEPFSHWSDPKYSKRSLSENFVWAAKAMLENLLGPSRRLYRDGLLKILITCNHPESLRFSSPPLGGISVIAVARCLSTMAQSRRRLSINHQIKNYHCQRERGACPKQHETPRKAIGAVFFFVFSVFFIPVPLFFFGT